MQLTLCCLIFLLDVDVVLLAEDTTLPTKECGNEFFLKKRGVADGLFGFL